MQNLISKLKFSFFLSFLFCQKLFAVDATWNTDADANWNINANWTPATFPNAVNDIARLLGVITDHRVITLGQNITIGELNIDNKFNYTITDPINSLTFQTSVGASTLSIKNVNGNGQHTISSAVSLNSSINISQQSNNFFEISGAISGVGSITYNGPQTMFLSGTTPNTFGFITSLILNNGIVFLNKTPGVNALSDGIISIQGGLLQLLSSNQIGNNAFIDIQGGTFNLDGFSETIGALIYLGGLVQLSGGTLTLSATFDPVLRMANTTLTGPVVITSPALSGSIRFDAVNNGMALINGTLNLGGNTRIFDIDNGTSDMDMVVMAIISNGGVTKDGPGKLVFTGTNTYAGGTTISEGTLQVNTMSLPGNVVDNSVLVFEQNFPGTFPGTITGTGTLIKQGTDNLTLTNANSVQIVSVNSGKLTVNGTLAAPTAFTVQSGAILGGIGAITANVLLNGTLAPGASIGTITLIGNQIFAAGSVLENELNPTSTDLVQIVGSLTIQPGSTLLVVPAPAMYTFPSTYLIINTTTGVTGTFSSVINTFPAFQVNVVYLPLQVLLQLLTNTFSGLVTEGNAAAVARCLDNLQGCSGSDLNTIIQLLRFSPTISDLQNNLNQLQPSQFTALALSQEALTKDVADVLFARLQTVYETCIDNCLSVWVAPLGAFSSQRDQNNEPGFKNQSFGTLVGMDFHLADNFYSGLGFAYTNTHLHWIHSRGNASINNYYADLYATWFCRYFYLKGAAIGAYNQYYDISRHITINFDTSTLKRYAKNHHNGWQGSGHLELGILFDAGCFLFSPFAEVDYLYFHEDSYEEFNAGSLNLHISKKNSDMFVSEYGIYISNCFNCFSQKFTPFIQFSVIHENRFKGEHLSATFETTGCCATCDSSCTFKVKGLYPNRTLYCGEGGITMFFPCDVGSLTFAYKGKFGRNFNDNLFFLQFVVNY